MAKKNKKRKDIINSFGKKSHSKPKEMGRTAKRAGIWTLTLLLTGGAFTGMYFWGKSAGNKTRPIRGILIPANTKNGDSSIHSAVERESKVINEAYTGIDVNLNVVEAGGDIYSFIKAGTHDFAWTSHSTWIDDVKNDLTGRGSHDPDRDKQVIEFLSLLARDSVKWDAPDVNAPEGPSFIPTKGYTWDHIRGDTTGAVEMKNEMENFSTSEGGEWDELEPGAKSAYYRAQLFMNEFGVRFWYTDGLSDEQIKDPDRPINKLLTEGNIANNDYVISNNITYISSGRSFLDPTTGYTDKTSVEAAIAAGNGWDVIFAYLDGIFNEAYARDIGDEVDLRDLFYLVDMRKEDANHFTDLSSLNKQKATQKFLAAYTSVTTFPSYIGGMPMYEELFSWEGFTSDKGYEAGSINGVSKTAEEIAIFETLYKKDFVDQETTYYFLSGRGENAPQGSATWVMGNIMRGFSLLGASYAGHRQQPFNSRDWADYQYLLDNPNASKDDIRAADNLYFKNNYKNTPAVAYSAITWNEGFAMKKGMNDARKSIVLDLIDFMVTNDEVIGEYPVYDKDGNVVEDDDGKIVTTPWRVNKLFTDYYTGNLLVDVDDSYWIDQIMAGEL